MAVAALLVISPGPNSLLIARTVPLSGKVAGFANVAGFITAFSFHGTLSILGISAILMASAQAFFVLKILGAAYLCWIGLKALYEAYRYNSTRPIARPNGQPRDLRSAYIEGLLTNVLNPKTSMFYLAAFPQFISTGENAMLSAFFLVLLHSTINVMWFGTMVMLLTRLSNFTRQGKFQRWLSIVTGVSFIGFGLKLATFRP